MSAFLTSSPIEPFFDAVGLVFVILLAIAETRSDWSHLWRG